MVFFITAMLVGHKFKEKHRSKERKHCNRSSCSPRSYYHVPPQEGYGNNQTTPVVKKILKLFRNFNLLVVLCEFFVSVKFLSCSDVFQIRGWSSFVAKHAEATAQESVPYLRFALYVT